MVQEQLLGFSVVSPWFPFIDAMQSLIEMAIQVKVHNRAFIYEGVSTHELRKITMTLCDIKITRHEQSSVTM